MVKIKTTPVNEIVDSLSTWYGMNTKELPRTTNDRAVWKAMITDTWNRHSN